MYRHIWAEIDLNALEHNVNNILEYVPAEKVIGVVKANAYGHGAGKVSKVLYEKGVRFFAVSNAYEAVDLRTVMSDCEILILGNVDPLAVKELAENRITVCLYDTECAKRLSSAALEADVTLKCHIKLDSGMGRLGLNCRKSMDKISLYDEIKEIFSLPALNITGAFTHFATADRDGDENAEFASEQYSRFKAGCDIIREIGQKPSGDEFVFHSSNSAATLLDSTVRPSDMYRPGIILYGLTPSAGLKLPCELKPVMTLKATVAQVKKLNVGECVSYGRTFTADRPMTVATVTVGYADGYPRNLSGKGYMLINGKKAPILGRVCMDQTVVDVSDIDGVRSGDTATLFGEGLPVEYLAEILGTINYELVSALAHRVPRVYIKNGEITDTVRYNSI